MTALASGVTAVIFDPPAVAAIDVRGGGPGTREGALLHLDNTRRAHRRHRTCPAARHSGSMPAAGCRPGSPNRAAALRIRDAVIPIVPGAICFDLLNGGNKAWGRFPPYRDLGYAAAVAASDRFRARQRRRRPRRHHGEFQGRPRLGFRGDAEGGIRVAALAVVNAVGSVTVGDGPWFWAAPFEIDAEFGGRGCRRLHAGHARDADQGRRGRHGRRKTPRSPWSSPTPR